MSNILTEEMKGILKMKEKEYKKVAERFTEDVSEIRNISVVYDHLNEIRDHEKSFIKDSKSKGNFTMYGTNVKYNSPTKIRPKTSYENNNDNRRYRSDGLSNSIVSLSKSNVNQSITSLKSQKSLKTINHNDSSTSINNSAYVINN